MTTDAENSSFVPLRAVIFDWAGTVCDFGSLAPVLALQKLFAAAGVPISMEQARGPMGRAKRDHIADVLLLPEVSARWLAAYGHRPDEADIDHLYAQFLPVQLAELRTRADLIPGVLPMTAELRKRGILIGSTTGYTRELMAELAPRAAQLGYAPDAMVTVSDVPAGRPAPWMALRCAEQLGAWPLSAVVKVGDTVADIKEGLHAGMWTVGFARCGNEVGLDEASLAALPQKQQQLLCDAARSRLRHAGAHFVVDGPAELLGALETLHLRRRRGDRP